MILVGLLLVTAVIGSLAPGVIERVIIAALVATVFVVGLQIYAGNAGIMSFGHVGFMAIGAYTQAYLSIPPPLKATYFADVPDALSFLLSVSAPYLVGLVLSGVVAAAFGLLVGPAMARLGGLQSGIATLAILVVVFTVINSWTSVTRGSSSIIGVPKLTTVWWAFVVAAIAVGIAWMYRQSASGLQLRASREDALAATASGISVGRHRLIAWVLSAFVCGMAGALYASFLTVFSSSTFFLALTFSYVVMIVAGGYLSVSGAVIGALGISVLQEIFRRFQDGQFTGGHALPPGVSQLLLSAVVLAVVIWAPLGVMGINEVSFIRGTRQFVTKNSQDAKC